MDTCRLLRAVGLTFMRGEVCHTRRGKCEVSLLRPCESRAAREGRVASVVTRGQEGHERGEWLLFKKEEEGGVGAKSGNVEHHEDRCAAL